MTFNSSTDESGSAAPSTTDTTETKPMTTTDPTVSGEQTERKQKKEHTLAEGDWKNVNKVVRNISFALLGTILLVVWMLQYKMIPPIAQTTVPIIGVALLGAAGVTGLGGLGLR